MLQGSALPLCSSYCLSKTLSPCSPSFWKCGNTGRHLRLIFCSNVHPCSSCSLLTLSRSASPLHQRAERGTPRVGFFLCLVFFFFQAATSFCWILFKTGTLRALVLSTPLLEPGRAVQAGFVPWGKRAAGSAGRNYLSWLLPLKALFNITLSLQSDAVQVRLQRSTGISSSVTPTSSHGFLQQDFLGMGRVVASETARGAQHPWGERG